jgi:hypothetical protein
MGTYYTNCDSQTTLKEFVAAELGDSATVVDWSIVGSCAYIVYRSGDGSCGAEVWKLSRCTDGYGHHIGYKPMDESMLPYFYDCPKRLLDKLTPTDSPNANEWRATCHAKRKRVNRARRIKDGDTIKLAAPLRFGGSDSAEDTFTAERWVDGRRVWRRLGNGQLVRITRLADRDFELIAK